MIATWMLASAVVATLLGAGAAALDALARRWSRPTRWIWLAAMAVAVVWTAAAPFRGAGRPVAAEGTVLPAAASEAVGEVEQESPAMRELSRQAMPKLTFPEPLRWLAAVQSRVPPAADIWLAGLWIMMSSSLLLAFAASQRRAERALRGWPESRIGSASVRIAPEAGPAVVGTWSPQLVLPRWVFSMIPEERDLVLCHEVEHQRGRDPAVLAAGCAALVCLPWNVPLWWMLSRLRLATELDCDRRVLRRGVHPQSYSRLLVEIASRCSAVPSFAVTPATSQLERRLIAMRKPHLRPSLPHALVLGAIAALAIFAACRAELPNSAEIQEMDLVTAEAALAPLRVEADDTVYFVDGQPVTSAEARALGPDQIESIEVVRGAPGGPVIEFRINTAVVVSTQGPDIGSTPQPEAGFAGLVLIDGSRSDAAAVRALNPQQILRLEMIKGAAAREIIDDPAASAGVLSITTTELDPMLTPKWMIAPSPVRAAASILARNSQVPDTLVFRNATWLSLGPDRIIDPALVEQIGEVDGDPLFVEAGVDDPFPLIRTMWRLVEPPNRFLAYRRGTGGY